MFSRLLLFRIFVYTCAGPSSYFAATCAHRAALLIWEVVLFSPSIFTFLHVTELTSTFMKLVRVLNALLYLFSTLIFAARTRSIQLCLLCPTCPLPVLPAHLLVRSSRLPFASGFLLRHARFTCLTTDCMSGPT